VLRITLGHADDVRAHRHEPTRRLLPAIAAVGTNVEHDLVARSAFVARPAENTTRQLEQRRIVVERGTRAPAQLAQGLAKRGERFGGHLEAQRVAPRGQVRRRSGRVPERRCANTGSSCRSGLPRANSSHSRSVSRTATRVSSRAADQLSSPLDSARASAGRPSSASATRSLS
jgi:hypothetical protein